MKNKASLSRNPVAKSMPRTNNYGCFHEEKRDKIILELVDKEGEEALLSYLESHSDNGMCLNDIGCSGIYISSEEEE